MAEDEKPGSGSPGQAEKTQSHQYDSGNPPPGQAPSVPDLEEFRRLAEQGFSLIRLDGKKPVEPGWQRYCTERRTFDEIGFRAGENAGIPCGPANEVLVLDEDDPEKFRAFLSAHGYKLPRTRTHGTGTEGKKHHLYRHPDDGCVYHNRSKKPWGFDIRGLNGQVVAPGSIHPDTGKKYVVLDDCPIAPAPAWLLSISHGEGTAAQAQTDVEGIGWDGNLDTLPVNDRVIGQIVNPPPRGERSEQEFSLLIALVKAGLSNDEIRLIWEEHPVGNRYRERGESGAWLNSQIGKARARAAAEEPQFEPVGSQEEPAKGQRGPFDVDDIQSLSCTSLGLAKPPPLKTVFKVGQSSGLPFGVVGFVAASGGTGKSTLWLQIAASVASGVNLCGSAFDFDPTPRSVLFIGTEDPEEILQRRLYEVRQLTPTELNLDRLYRVCGAHHDYRLLEKGKNGNLQPSKAFHGLVKLIKRIPDLALVILDPLSRFFVGESNGSEDATYMVSLLERIREASGGATVICTAHVSKAAGNVDSEAKLHNALSQHSLRGSSGFVDGSRWVMTMAAVPEILTKKLGFNPDVSALAWRICKNSYMGQTRQEYFERRPGEAVLRPISPASTEEATEVDRMLRLLDLIKDSPRPLTARGAQDRLHNGLGVTKLVVERLIDSALKDGLIEQYEDLDANKRPRMYLRAVEFEDGDDEKV